MRLPLFVFLLWRPKATFEMRREVSLLRHDGNATFIVDGVVCVGEVVFRKGRRREGSVSCPMLFMFV